MDPRIDPAPAQPDLAPDPSIGDESVDYLRRLKRAAVEAAPADAVARGGGGAPAAANSNSNAWKERRQSPRLVVRAARSFEPRETMRVCGELLPTSACTDAMSK